MANENKFKVGDKVRRVVCGDYFGMTEGDVGTVSFVYPDGDVSIGGFSGQHAPYSLELVTEHKETKTFTVPTNTRDMVLRIDSSGDPIITCGCFDGTIEEAEELAKKKGRDDYIAAVALLKSMVPPKEPEIRWPKCGEVWFLKSPQLEYHCAGVDVSQPATHFVNTVTGCLFPVESARPNIEAGHMIFSRDSL